MRFVFTHSHVFPGGRVVLADDSAAGTTCLVSFFDGTTVCGEWRREGPDILLDVPAYATAKGTEIDPHTWRLSLGGEGIWRARPAG